MWNNWEEGARKTCAKAGAVGRNSPGENNEIFKTGNAPAQEARLRVQLPAFYQGNKRKAI